MIRLQRDPNDRTMRGDAIIQCCDCGLQHLWSIEVVRTPDDKFYAIRRAYRINHFDGPPRPKSKRPRKKK